MRLELKHICGLCKGTGFITFPDPPGAFPIPCETCSGTGELYWGHADALMDELDEIDVRLSDIMDRVNDVLDKCNDILEAIQSP